MKLLLLRALAVVDVVPTQRELDLLKVAGLVWAVMLGIPAVLFVSSLA